MTQWSRVKLKEVCQSIIDCINKTAPTVDYVTPHKMIRTTNVRNGYVDISEVRYVETDVYEKWTRRQVPKRGDVILTREAPLGEVGMLRTDEPVFLGQRLMSYRVDEAKLDNYFLLYSLMGDDLQGQIRSLGSGSTVEHMRVGDAENLEICLPPLDLQKHIGNILAVYDDLILHNTRRIQILEEMAQRIYEEWFVNFRFPGHEDVEMVESELGPIPKGWEVTGLAESCDITMGQSPKSEFYNDVGEGLPFHQGVSDFGYRFPMDRIYCTVKNRLAEPGDILFSVRAPVGRMNLSTKQIVIGRGLCAIRNMSGDQEFTYQQLRERFQEEDSIGGGTIFKAVTKADMYGIPFLLPDKPLLKKFKPLMTPIFAQLKNLTAKNIFLRRTRDLLLPKLISGELDVSQFDDEETLEGAA